MLEITNARVYDLRECVVASGNSMRLEAVEYTDEEFAKGLERCRRLCRFGGGSGQTNFRTGIRVSFDMKYTQYITKQFQRYHWFDYVNSSSLMHRITRMDFSKCCNKYVSATMKGFMKSIVSLYNLMSDNISLPEVFADLVKDYGVFVESEYGETLPSMPDKEYLYDCYMRIISNCPMGTELFVRVSTNYEQLATIVRQREGHKLREDYGNFMEFVRSLPYAEDFILCETKKD